MDGGPMWRSAYPEVRVSPAFVDEEILAALDARPAAAVLTDAATGRTLTGGELADRIRRTAAGLRGRGARTGDVLAIVAANNVEYAVALYGGLAAGMALTQAHAMLTPGELARQFGRTRPRFVAADAMAMTAVSKALTEHEPAVEAVFELDDLPSAEPAAAPARTPDDVALLFNSSGTSGAPKTVIHTHASVTAFLQLFPSAPTMRFDPTDTVGLVTPLAHLYGTAILSHSLRSGARVALGSLVPGDIEGFVRLLADHAVTVTTVTPPVMLALARHPVVERYDLSSLRQVICGAAPLPRGIDVEVEERLGCSAVDTLGATESWCHSPPADPPVRGSVGTLLPNNEAVIVDPGTGRRMSAGEVGELWVRGPQIMRGYLGDDTATAETLTADGWLRTGDLCRFDEAGNIYVVDRLKEMIKIGGSTVAPAEVEAELLDHPAVADVAVVARPDAEFGEVPVAYVVAAYDLDPAELLEWLAARLAPWKRLHDVVFVEQIPRSPVGKILRRVLRDRERAAQPLDSSRS